VDERKMEGEKKGFLKIHAAVNVKSKKILSMKVTKGHVHGGRVLPELAEDIAKSNEEITDKLFAGVAYGSNDIFGCLAVSCVYPCTKARKNARVRPKTSYILGNPSAMVQ
jgi:Transposase DDE domain